MENEKMKLENEGLEIQLKEKEKEWEIHPNRSEAEMTPHAPLLEMFEGKERT